MFTMCHTVINIFAACKLLYIGIPWVKNKKLNKIPLIQLMFMWSEIILFQQVITGKWRQHYNHNWTFSWVNSWKCEKKLFFFFPFYILTLKKILNYKFINGNTCHDYIIFSKKINFASNIENRMPLYTLSFQICNSLDIM